MKDELTCNDHEDDREEMDNLNIEQQDLDPQDRDLLKIYFKDISGMKLLTQEEAIALATERDNGDKEAEEQLVIANLRLVANIAKKYKGIGGLEYADLIQEGSMGLMSAAKEFDPSQGYRFSTYASTVIENSIRTAISMKGRIICTPKDQIVRAHKIHKAASALAASLGRSPTQEEISQKTGLSVKQIQTALRYEWQQPHSYDVSVNADDKDGVTVRDLIVDPAASVEDRVLSGKKENWDKDVKRLLGTLREKERAVMEIYLRLGTEEEHADCTVTEDDIQMEGPFKRREMACKQLCMSWNELTQMEEVIVRRLRHPSRYQMAMKMNLIDGED